jgi:cytoskeletal protein CcmA (bactofilin family)
MRRSSLAITVSVLVLLLAPPVTPVPALATVSKVQAGRLGPVGVPAGQVIDRDAFAAGPLVEISGTVNGDLYAAGGQVLIDGRVNGDVLVAGGRVMLSGAVAQNVRVAGGQVSLSGTVGRNVTVFGGNVELTPGAVIAGSLVVAGGNVHLAAPLGGSATVAAGSLILSNRVGGEVQAAVGALRIGPKADIRGRVAYISRREASVDPGARIEQGLTRMVPPAIPRLSPHRIVAVFAAVTFVIMAVSFASTLVLGLLSLRFLPRYHETAVRTLREQPWSPSGRVRRRSPDPGRHGDPVRHGPGHPARPDPRGRLPHPALLGPDLCPAPGSGRPCAVCSGPAPGPDGPWSSGWWSMTCWR